MSQNVHGTFISEKPNKIRWRPDAFGFSHSFISGSWDNHQNYIKLWDFVENESDIYPYIVNNYPFEGDITEAQFANADCLIASSSLGSLHCLKVSSEKTGETIMIKQMYWNSIHKSKNGYISSCTFAMHNNDIVTVGEDGNINVLTLDRIDIVRTINEADSCSLNCVTFLKFNEILTGNLRGQMKIWDLRTHDGKPSTTFMLSGDQIAATCLTYHPTQQHMVVAGDEEGSLTVWDLRQNIYPVNLLSAHSGSVAEIHFHPDHPSQLFSCSNSGELWHWITNGSAILLDVDNSETNPWFSIDGIKNKFEVSMLMPKLHKPINSLDVSRNRVLCGCDNEAVYLINNLNVYI